MYVRVYTYLHYVFWFPYTYTLEIKRVITILTMYTQNLLR